MPSRLLRSGISAILLALTPGLMASAQTATTALAGITPNQLHDGTATFMGHYNSNQKLRLVIGLQHPHLAEEEQFLNELHTKGSPNFQKFLTADEWNARFGPSVADEQAVVDWATSQGLTVTNRFSNRLLVDVEAPAGAIEKVFGVTMNRYQVGTRAAFSNDRDPVIPTSLGNIIHSIGGLNSIQVLRPANKAMQEPAFADYVEGPTAAVAGSGAADAKAKPPVKGAGLQPNITGGAYDPTDIYGSPAYDVSALNAQGHCCNPLSNPNVSPAESSIAIATAGSQAASDLSGFQSAYPYLAFHYQQFDIDGTPSCCDEEGTADFDWSTAWANSLGSSVNTAMIYLYDGASSQLSTFTDVYNQILTDGHARVFSTSWGCEELACTPQSVMDTDHGIFNAMAGQGWTMVAASGEQGATAGCGDAVAVQYPASDPNIVGAGGTTLNLNSSSQFISETAWSGGLYGCSINDGGSTGGASAYYAAPGYQSNTGYSNRTVPDIALNADWVNSPQNFYYNGYLQGNGGTNIVAPSVAGFFAQANAYLDYVATQNGGCGGTTSCTPLGNGNYYLYWFGNNPTYAAHYPYYDITQGCNNNDITAEYGLSYYCAGTGYDEVTGWGSFNALQLSWAINAYKTGDFAAPSVTFTGPLTNHWYNTNQEVSWTVADAGTSGFPATGVSGFTSSWYFAPVDSTKAPSGPRAPPDSAPDGFYTGPEYSNSTSGHQYVATAGQQGCLTTYVPMTTAASTRCNHMGQSVTTAFRRSRKLPWPGLTAAALTFQM
jgi:kumamolisin